LLLALASVTDSLVTLATHVIRDLGLAGVALLTLTTGVIGLPGTEPTMLFAGFNVSEGHQTLFGIISFGVIGDMAGASIAYAIGYFGRVELVERHGNKLHVSKRRLQTAHRWFDRYGSPVIFVSRILPLVRAVFPYAAGVSEMPFARFFSFALLGSIVWISGLGILGQAVGSSWTGWRHNLEYVDYIAAAAFVAAIVYLIVRRAQGRGKNGAGDADEEGTGGRARSEGERTPDVVS
jgi:membrane protein DedA with SNARE-associated domain